MMNDPPNYTRYFYDDEVIWWNFNDSVLHPHIAEYPFVEGFFVAVIYTDNHGMTSCPTHGPFESLTGAAAAIRLLGLVA